MFSNFGLGYRAYLNFETWSVLWIKRTFETLTLLWFFDFAFVVFRYNFFISRCLYSVDGYELLKFKNYCFFTSLSSQYVRKQGCIRIECVLGLSRDELFKKRS